MKVSPPFFMPEYEPSKRRLTWPNGVVATVYSGDEPDQLRGPQFDAAWVDELAKFKYPKETWDNLKFGLRTGASPRVCVTTTPRPIQIIKDIIKAAGTIDVRRSTYDNFDNLSPVYKKHVIEPLMGTRLGRQEIEGEIIEDVEGALWTIEMIDKNRVRLEDCPQFKRIVIPIDPEATSTKDSAMTGIIPVAKGVNDEYYVLHDYSLRGRPEAWGAKAINAYHDLKADIIIGEVNNGGEMIEAVIKSLDDSVNYKAVRASRGKLTRAEPVSALYAQGKVHHVGCLPALEDQMCSWVPGDKSPDQMDSLVWGITELMEAKSKTNWKAVTKGLSAISERR